MVALLLNMLPLVLLWTSTSALDVPSHMLGSCLINQLAFPDGNPEPSQDKICERAAGIECEDNSPTVEMWLSHMMVDEQLHFCEQEKASVALLLAGTHPEQKLLMKSIAMESVYALEAFTEGSMATASPEEEENIRGRLLKIWRFDDWMQQGENAFRSVWKSTAHYTFARISGSNRRRELGLHMSKTTDHPEKRRQLVQETSSTLSSVSTLAPSPSNTTMEPSTMEPSLAPSFTQPSLAPTMATPEPTTVEPTATTAEPTDWEPTKCEDVVGVIAVQDAIEFHCLHFAIQGIDPQACDEVVLSEVPGAHLESTLAELCPVSLANNCNTCASPLNQPDSRRKLQGGFCPEDHPYTYNGGEGEGSYCCSVEPLTYGNGISICADSGIICEGPPCSDFQQDSKVYITAEDILDGCHWISSELCELSTDNFLEMFEYGACGATVGYACELTEEVLDIM